jgi:2-dehydro-3-deoxygalactonokinase
LENVLETTANFANKPCITVDWGTSSFRAALLAPNGDVLDELSTSRGILSFKHDEFVPYLTATCARFILAGGQFFLLSGMIGSKNGLLEVPYCACPATASHIAAALGWVDTGNADLNIAIVPGLRYGFDDVMRGEETQVFGAAALLDLHDAVMVLPGTHSKWAQLKDGAVVKFNTFMTGEFYALLAQHSILAKSLPDAAINAPSALDGVAFLQGVARARFSGEAGQSLLSKVFSTRVKSLFNELQPPQAASYLSGLLIGDELAAMHLKADRQVIIIGSATLCERYTLALNHLGVPTLTIGNQAAWAGLHSIYKQMTVSL